MKYILILAIAMVGCQPLVIGTSNYATIDYDPNHYIDYNGERFYWNRHYNCWVGKTGHLIGGKYHKGYPKLKVHK